MRKAIIVSAFALISSIILYVAGLYLIFKYDNPVFIFVYYMADTVLFFSSLIYLIMHVGNYIIDSNFPSQRETTPIVNYETVEPSAPSLNVVIN